MSRAGSAWSSRPRIWRCSPRWCRACGTARSRPMLWRAVRPCTPRPGGVRVVVALPAGPGQQPPDWLAKLGGERLGLVPGGDTRAQSVRAGLRALTPHATVVLVHDAARPFVSRETIDGAIARAGGGGGGAAPARVTATVPDAAERREIVTPVRRERTRRSHSPYGSRA